MKCTVSVTCSCQLGIRFEKMQPAPSCNREGRKERQRNEKEKKRDKMKKKRKNIEKKAERWEVKKRKRKEVIHRSKRLYDCIDQVGEK